MKIWCIGMLAVVLAISFGARVAETGSSAYVFDIDIDYIPAPIVVGAKTRIIVLVRDFNSTTFNVPSSRFMKSFGGHMLHLFIISSGLDQMIHATPEDIEGYNPGDTPGKFFVDVVFPAPGEYTGIARGILYDEKGRRVRFQRSFPLRVPDPQTGLVPYSSLSRLFDESELAQSVSVASYPLLPGATSTGGVMWYNASIDKNGTALDPNSPLTANYSFTLPPSHTYINNEYCYDVEFSFADRQTGAPYTGLTSRFLETPVHLVMVHQSATALMVTYGDFAKNCADEYCEAVCERNHLNIFEAPALYGRSLNGSFWTQAQDPRAGTPGAVHAALSFQFNGIWRVFAISASETDVLVASWAIRIGPAPNLVPSPSFALPAKQSGAVAVLVALIAMLLL
eukprot:ANDGO_02893.mRNA.1 hypothetical protein